MKAKFGAIVVDGRGKIGGHVASKNRAGSYFRTKVTPVNKQSEAQLRVRNRFTGISQRWRALQETEREAWNSAVSGFAQTDIFGDLRNPTGFNLFQRLNNNLVTVKSAQIDAPPLPSSVGEVVATEMAQGTGPLSLSVTLAAAVPVGTAIKVFATAPQSAGKSFVKSEYRLIGTFPAESGPSLDILTMYQRCFGEVAQAGQKVFVKVEAINTVTGQNGTPSQVSTVV